MHHFSRALLGIAATAVILLTACRKDPTPPAEIPAVSGPRVTYINTICTFQAAPADSQLNSVRMRFDWGDGDTSAWGDKILTGYTGSAMHFWTHTGTYLVSSQAQNKDGELSDWCVPCTLAVVNRTPDRPLLEGSVPDGFVDSTYSFMIAGNDFDGESLSYRIAWGDGDTLDWTGPHANGTWQMVSHTWRTFAACTLRAQVRDAHDSVSAWSESLLVTIRTVPPALKWRFEAGQRILSSPAIGPDGAIYFGSSDDYVYCLNPEGTLRWRFQTGDNVEGAPVIAPDGTVYIHVDSLYYALRPDGTLKWRLDTSHGVGPGPALGADGTIYGVHSRYLYAIDDTGTVRWSCTLAVHVHFSPSVGPDGTIYSARSNDDLVAISPQGTALWSARYGYPSAPAIDNSGNIYAAAHDTLTARAPDSTILWRCAADFSHVTEPVIGEDGTIYVGGLSHYNLVAVNANGTLKWDIGLDTHFASLGPALLADGTIVAGMDNSYVYGINGDGRVKWRYHTGPIVESSPAVAPDGTIYIGAVDGYLYALAGTSPLANAPWPKYRHDNRNTGRSGGP